MTEPRGTIRTRVAHAMDTLVGRRCLIAFLVLFSGMQISLTVLNKNFWPFSSHNFFAYTSKETVQFIEYSMTDAQGFRRKGVPGNFMPIEFFRANSITYDVFHPSLPDGPKRQLAEHLLVRVGERPWGKFDETLAAPVKPGERFQPVELTITVEDRRYDAKAPGTVAKASRPRTIFTHRISLPPPRTQ